MVDVLEFLYEECNGTYFDKENGILLFQGDCLEILPKLVKLKPLSLDCIVSDPPYGINYVSNHRKSTDILGKAINNDHDLTMLGKALPYLDGLLKNNSAVYFFGHPNMIGENRQLLDKFWKHKNTLVWDKGDAGTFGDLEAGYSLNYESIFYYNKGRRILNGLRPRTIIRCDRIQAENRAIKDIHADEFLSAIYYLVKNISEDKREEVLAGLAEDLIGKALYNIPKAQLRKDWSSRNDPVHATTKPVSLLKLLLKYSSDKGDIVIDAFMGSGVTGAAAKSIGRKFIGIEMSPHFYRVAQDRIRCTNPE